MLNEVGVGKSGCSYAFTEVLPGASGGSGDDEEMDSGQVLKAEMPELGHGLNGLDGGKKEGKVEGNSKFFALVNFLCTLFKY